FPLPVVGLIGVRLPVAVRVVGGFGVLLPRSVLVGVPLCLALATGMVPSFAFPSLVSIHMLCPWCMVVWAVTIPMFWYTALFVLAELTPARWVRVLQSWHLVPVVVWYLAVAGLILWAFWDFYWADFFANL